MEQYHDSVHHEQRLSAPSWPQPSQIIFPRQGAAAERGECEVDTNKCSRKNLGAVIKGVLLLN